jgi:hypothetical protein
MAQKSVEPQDEKSRLQKKIEDYTQFQWLVFIPVWVPGILKFVNPTPTVPGREIYVLLFHIGTVVFSIVAFVLIRLQIKKLKRKLALLENPAGVETKPFDPPLPGA